MSAAEEIVVEAEAVDEVSTDLAVVENSVSYTHLTLPTKA